MKKINMFSAIVLAFLLVISCATSEGFLPSLDEELGIDMPYINKCISKSSSNVFPKDDGRVQEVYEDVSFSDYDHIGRCFGKSGFIVTSKKFSDDTIHLLINKQSRNVELDYNIEQYKLSVICPKYRTEDTDAYFVNEDLPSTFPTIEEMAGVILPRLSIVLKRKPDSSKKENNQLVEEYNGFSEEDYKSVSEYLLNQECTVKDYQKTEDNLLIIHLEKKGSGFTLEYNPDKHSATVRYPVESYIEPIVTSTPVPTATPAPTVNPDDYNSYAAIFVTTVKATRKKPDSLDVHSIRVMEYAGDLYIVIDFSAINSFGGYARETYSFKFEPGYISLTGDSSDYDTYENHKSEFSLVANLDVSTVLRLVNK